MTITFDEDNQKLKLAEIKRREKSDLIQAMASKFGLNFIDLSQIQINLDALRVVPEQTSRTAGLAAFDINNRNLKVAIISPNNPETAKAIEALKTAGYILDIFMASENGVESAQEKYKELSLASESHLGAVEISDERMALLLGKIKSVADIKATFGAETASKEMSHTSKLVEILMSGALAVDASDIHIEPEENGTRLRYRLDGVLKDVSNFDQKNYNALLSRIKLMAGLKLNVKDQAQDGRFTAKIKGDDIEARVSVVPGNYGESIVMRILNPKSIAVPLEDLGIPKKLLGILLKEIGKPNGMILNTGPTGSGKTTTLYAFLKKVYTPDLKIITIEDPVEYHLPGIVQTQAEEEKGYGFLEGLRAALRQDPDIIMVGEIRDSETATTAINAALTGHLVFSTLHTNNAAGAFPRLIDLGANPKVITSAVSVAMAQRLVRKLCEKCKKEIPLKGDDKKLVVEIFNGIADKTGLENSEKMWAATGCDFCNHTGYKGRIGVYEAVLSDSAVEKAVNEKPSEREIKAAAKPQAIMDMAEDGIMKVLNGITSLEELKRVVNLEER